MKRYNRAVRIFFLVVILAAASALLALPQESQNISSTARRTADDEQLPVAEFAMPDPVDPKERGLRQVKSSRYNRQGGKPIAELPPGVEELPLNAHWWWGLPALPVRMSQAILIGEIVDAKAYLSSDRTGVYSEFTIRINEVLRKGSDIDLVLVGDVLAQRPGGAVRFPSGRLQRYTIAQQGMPLIGRRYVFFLKCNTVGQDFSILTGYELRNGRVLPLDGHDNKGETVVSAFAAFEGMDETAFLKSVREAISRPSEDSLEKGKPR